MLCDGKHCVRRCSEFVEPRCRFYPVIEAIHRLLCACEFIIVEPIERWRQLWPVPNLTTKPWSLAYFSEPLCNDDSLINAGNTQDHPTLFSAQCSCLVC